MQRQKSRKNMRGNRESRGERSDQAKYRGVGCNEDSLVEDEIGTSG